MAGAAPSSGTPAKEDEWYVARSLPETPSRPPMSPRRKRWVVRSIVAVVLTVIVVVAAFATYSYIHPTRTAAATPLPTATFRAGGLAAAVAWTISVWTDGYLIWNATSTSPSVDLVNLTNGTYEVYANASGYAPFCGSFAFGNASASVWVNFTPAATYPVSFAMNGYPSDNGWQVRVACYYLYTNGADTLVVNEPNGTYGWSMAISGYGYSCTPLKGQVPVAGQVTSIKLTCTYEGPFLPRAGAPTVGPTR